MKVCRKCFINKPLSEFYKNPDSKDGHIQTCRLCKDASERTKTSRVGEVRRLLQGWKKTNNEESQNGTT